MTHIESCRTAAKQLGVTVLGPVAIPLSGGRTIQADMLVLGFGAPFGTLVVSSRDSLWPHRAELAAAGLTSSNFGESSEEMAAEDLREMLLEWIWAGPEVMRPAWA